ncbi:ankyrin repeat-containing domain protein [Biscogniauxia mediterranea]|nr:ankyrin repeat-containing domain protein [Biscogniauxia mediterranea]
MELYNLIAESKSVLPHTILTVSGIVLNAKRGVQALQDYQALARFPRGKRRHRIQELALYCSLQDPVALTSMLRANFDITMPQIVHMLCEGYRMESPVYVKRGTRATCDVLRDILEKIPLSDLSPSTINLILGAGDSTRRCLIQVCIDSDNPEDLRSLNRGLGLREGEGAAILVKAAQRNGFKQVELLLREFGIGINENLKSPECQFSVLMASLTGVREGDNADIHLPSIPKPATVDMLNFLLHQGADIQSCEPVFESNDITLAPDRIKWLIQNGLDLSRQSLWSILQHTSDGDGAEDIPALLIQASLPVFSSSEIEDHKAPTAKENPLSFFIRFSSDLRFLRKVVDSGIDINGHMVYQSGDTPLQAAVRKGDLKLVQYIVECGARVNDSDAPLRRACEHPEVEAVRIAEYLIEKGANVDGKLEGSQTPDDTGVPICSPLQTALSSKILNLPLIELLIRRGADVNIRMLEHKGRSTPDELTALHKVLAKDYEISSKYKLVKMLIDHGADVNRMATSHFPVYRRISPLQYFYDYLSDQDMEENRWANDSGLDIEKLLREQGAQPGCITRSMVKLQNWSRFANIGDLVRLYIHL